MMVMVNVKVAEGSSGPRNQLLPTPVAPRTQGPQRLMADRCHVTWRCSVDCNRAIDKTIKLVWLSYVSIAAKAEYDVTAKDETAPPKHLHKAQFEFCKVFQTHKHSFCQCSLCFSCHS